MMQPTNNGEFKGQTRADIGYLKANTDKIWLAVDEIRHEVVDLKVKVAVVSAIVSAGTAVAVSIIVHMFSS